MAESTRALFNKDFGLKLCRFLTLVVILVYHWVRIPWLAPEVVDVGTAGVDSVLFALPPAGSLACRRNSIANLGFSPEVAQRRFY